ncbi:unnamed protein product, partial [Didymodactylos carnosus]
FNYPAHPPSSLVKKKDNWQRIKLYRNRPAVSVKSESTSLDPNHTHFLLLDDGYGESDEWKKTFPDGVRSDLILHHRAAIEREASEIRKSKNKQNYYKVPVIQILAEGGPSSILTINKALDSRTPLIVIANTGRAADLIAEEHQKLYGTDKKRSMDEYIKLCETDEYKTNLEAFKSRTEHPCINKTNRDDYLRIMASEIGYFLINVFNFGSEKYKLDDAILQALFNAAELKAKTGSGEPQHVEELKLAMAWNKYKRVQTQILTDEKIDFQLDEALKNAVRLNSVQFCILLMEFGASFGRLRNLIDISNSYGVLYNIFDEGKPKNDEQEEVDYTNNISFNSVDMVTTNGYVDNVSINFRVVAPSKQGEPSPEIWLFVISSTNDSVPRKYSIVSHYKIPAHKISQMKDGVQTFHIAEDTAFFVASGQYLAVGFCNNSNLFLPASVNHRNQYSISFDRIEEAVDATTTNAERRRSTSGASILELITRSLNKSIEFENHQNIGTAFCFNIIPSP